LIGGNILLTALVLIRLSHEPIVEPLPPSSSRAPLPSQKTAQASVTAGEQNLLDAIATLREAAERIQVIPSLANESDGSLEATLLDEANRLSEQINALGDVNKEDVIVAAQLWRQAQLTLEAANVAQNPEGFERLRMATSSLQTALAKKIPAILETAYDDASKASGLKAGLVHWARAGAYLAMLPNDGSPASAEIAQKMGYEHENVRQELLQKAQTTYNLWACEQIKKSWVDIKEVNSPVSKSDNAKFYHSCVHFLAPIESSLLDMSTGELYREVLQFVRERMPMEDFQELIKAIHNGDKRSLDD
jgi:hypothetical protein